MTDDFRAAILDAHKELEALDKPRGTRQVVRFLREARGYELSSEDQEAIERAGWSVLVSGTLRGLTTDGGQERKLVSVPSVNGRDYKQLAFILLEDAMGVLQMYESQERASSINARAWRQIVATLMRKPEGTTVADLFPTEDRWETFWGGIRDSELAA